ncbi:type II secretion system F family protein [Massilia sp. CF038]|uniref:type II secretion system F family protein n=1 Tax=Massilia sp. CF038 TaxID=1881045 RepID=UPI000914CBBB|nr:type II secretion system F family protein [Massilia sp. CF038]SHG67518.1 general secretion pathway protein F [Massilia sp. CF038]
MSRLRPLALPVRALLFQHLAAMEKAGVPPDRAYALLDLGAASRSRVQAFQRLVARGIDPPTAGANSGLFNTFETRLLRAAFNAGSPYPTYKRLARQLATAATQAMTLRNRMMMPVAVLVIALFVAPIAQLITGALSTSGYLLKVLGPMVVLAVAGIAAARLVAWFNSGAPGPGRAALERSLLALPLFGKLHLRANARDFSESLALLLEAGLPLFDALPLALDTVINHQVRADLSTITARVRAGAPLAHAIGALQLVDISRLHPFVVTGEEGGTLAEMLMRHADTESEALALAQSEIMAWLPRVFYAGVALWMIAHLLATLPTARDAAALGVPQWQT